MILPYQNLSNEVREKKYDRLESINNVCEFEEKNTSQSQRQFAREHNIPRATLQYWLKRKNTLDASPALVAFFEGPDGFAFLHRLITAAHFKFTKVGIASVHNVSNFLKACGLDSFVVCSYTTHQRISRKMDNELINFGRFEHDRLAGQMPFKVDHFGGR